MSLCAQRWGLRSALSFVMVVGLTGCPTDPYDPATWIEKLEEPENRADLDQGVKKLVELHDPEGIPALGRAWEKYRRSDMLQGMVTLAEGYEDSEGKMHGPYWDEAVPFLVTAVEDFDLSDARSIEQARAAAMALGEAKDPSTVQVLVKTATRTMPKLHRGQNARIAAIRALGGFAGDQRAADTLITILEADGENSLALARAAAADALGAMRAQKAIDPLILAMFAPPPVPAYARAALIQMGKPAIKPVTQAFQGTHKAVRAYAKAHAFASGCDRAIGPGSKCQRPGAVAYLTATVLGDLHAKSAVPMLIKGLKEPSQVTGFHPKTGVPGPPSHNAILGALARIGGNDAADALYTYWSNDSTDDVIRPLAMHFYSLVAANGRGMDKLANYMTDNAEEEAIRKSAASAYARLVREKRQLAPISKLVDKYRDAAAKAKRQADRIEKAAERIKNKKKQQAKLDEAAVKMADYQGYTNSQRLFEQHLARAVIGIDCGAKASCYTEYLSMPTTTIIERIAKFYPGAKKIEGQARSHTALAAQERALIELAKLGAKARGALPQVLAKADKTERVIREAVLMALPKIAPTPCKECVEKLESVVAAQKDQARLSSLTADTRAVLSYFRWAGK